MYKNFKYFLHNIIQLVSIRDVVMSVFFQVRQINKSVPYLGASTQRLASGLFQSGGERECFDERRPRAQVGF